MADLSLVTCCGLYCGLCGQRNRIPVRARALRDSMQREGYEFWGDEIPGFREFWTFLRGLAEPDQRCTCRGGRCGPPFCGIRTCASSRGVETCPFCESYPCDRIRAIATGYPTLLADGARMKAIGIEAWIAEQEKRAETGFAYVDIRCEPYEIPR